MSKEKPEVGDIWMRKNKRYFIRDIKHFRQPQILWIDENLDKDGEPLDIFLKLWKYSGKAKAKISDLFEVKNDF